MRLQNRHLVLPRCQLRFHSTPNPKTLTTVYPTPNQDEVDRLTRAAMLLGVVCGLGVAVWHTLGATALLAGLNTGTLHLSFARYLSLNAPR